MTYPFSVWTEEGERPISDVYVEPLKDSEGRVVGVMFPTRPGGSRDTSDLEMWSEWVGLPKKLYEQRFHVLEPDENISSVKWAEPDAGVPAPWAASAEDGLLLVIVHGDKSGTAAAALNFGTHSSPDWKIAQLPGNMLGWLVAANEDFQNASGLHPEAPLLYLSCLSGNDEHGHARDFASALHNAGLNHDVHAPKGVAYTVAGFRPAAALGIRADHPADAIGVYPATSPAPDAG